MVADSHVGEHLPRLPAEVLEILAGCEVILHAGDLTGPRALDPLRELAPVLAVAGDHDRSLVGVELPGDLVLEIGGVRLAVTHGNRPKPLEYAARAATLARGRLVDFGLDDHLLRRFGPVDCIVHGHLHVPRERWVGGTLIFSPGAVYTREHDQLPWLGLAGRAVGRFRGRLPAAERQAAVGVLEIGSGRIVPRRYPLQRRLRAPVAL